MDAISGAPAAATSSAASSLSASTRQHLQDLNVPAPALAPLPPEPSLGKRSAGSAELPDRASQASEDMTAAEPTDDDPSNMALTFMCAFTAEAPKTRHADGGIKVCEEGKAVEYKAICGKEWCTAAQANSKAALKKSIVNTIAIIYRGLPDPDAVLPFYEAHGTNYVYYGTLLKPAKANFHMFASVKTDELDGSGTLVFNTVNRLADTPLMCRHDL